MCNYRRIIAKYVVTVGCMLAAPAGLQAEEEPVRGEGRIRAESVSAYTRDELPPARRARMTGRSVYHDRNDGVVVVIDEAGNVARRIDAKDARVIINGYTEDFLVARTPGVGEKTSVKVFDRRGELKLDIEVDLGPGPKERIVGTLDNALITRPFALGSPGTKYIIYRYDQDGRQILVEEPDITLASVYIYGGNRILAEEGLTFRKAIRKYDSKGVLRHEYSFTEIFNRYFVSPDGRHLLTCYEPKGERHIRKFVLHIEGRRPVEWEAGIPRAPVIFRDDEEIVVYREWPQRLHPTAYTYDGRRLWSIREKALAIAVHKIGHRSILSSYELKDGVPRVSHYSMENGTLLGITDLREYIDIDEYRDRLDRVPGRFYADDEGNVNIPIPDAYVTISLNRREQ